MKVVFDRHIFMSERNKLLKTTILLNEGQRETHTCMYTFIITASCIVQLLFDKGHWGLPNDDVM